MNKYLKFSNYLEYFKNRLIKYQKSYSQAGEDLILNNFFKYKNTGVYVDVGANDPKRFNNTYLFYLKGWRGINIEPNIKKVSQLKKIRNQDVNLNLGVGENNGELTFYEFKPDTLSTFSKEIADEYLRMGHRLNETKKVQVLPLSSIFEKYLTDTKIDFMTIDTEGHDLEVLKSNDWEKYRPSYLIVETLEFKNDDSAKKINGEFDEYLAKIDYSQIVDTYVNTIYKDNKHV